MNRLAIILLALLFSEACTTYKEFIKVQPNSSIPESTQFVVVTSSMEDVKDMFRNNGILIKTMGGGFITDEILLDEGTRAMYKAVQFDGQVQLSAYWGITQKVKSEMVVWAGQSAASAYDVNAWTKVLYNKASWRPKKVFDYLVQVVESKNFVYALR